VSHISIEESSIINYIKPMDAGENKYFRYLNDTLPVERGVQRLREIIVYISKKSEMDSHFGAVKLNKILYHSDFRMFERFGHPLTGCKYFKLQNGPAPRSLFPIREELINEGALRLEKRQLGRGYTQDRTIALREPVLSHFSADEIAVVDEVIAELWDQTAREVSDASHDVRWRILELKDPIPYEFAYIDNKPVSAEENSRTRELANRFGW